MATFGTQSMSASSKARLLARKAKAHLIRFDAAHRPIVVMALRRGGSTMVADTISINRGVWGANEPFAVFDAHPGYDLKQRLLPPREHSQFFELDPEELDQFARFAKGLLGAQYPQLGSCARPKPFLKADRVCLKVLNAPWMIDWFAQNTNAHVLPLVRHPGAQAISVLRQNWGFAVEAYGRQLDRIGHHFSEGQRGMITDVLKGDDTWAIAILDYAVLTRLFFTGYTDRIVRYEDIVTDPARFVDEVLIAQFGLSERDRMLATLSRPSHSSRMSLNSVNEAIKAGKTNDILHNWRSKVTPEMLAVGQRILDMFDIETYHFLDDRKADLQPSGKRL